MNQGRSTGAYPDKMPKYRKESTIMQIYVDERAGSRVAVITSEEVLLANAQDALDLMADVKYLHDCDKILLHKTHASESFFDLSTGVAGEILQKFTNYHIRIAIVGDYSGYTSKSLKDFIYESNKGKKVLFLETRQAALDALHEE